jgi:uncharacterized membrane protein YhaH (DUF805 family)
MNFGNLFFGFSDRVNRAKWWLVMVVWAIVWLALSAMLVFLVGVDATTLSSEDFADKITGLSGWVTLLILVVLIPLAVSAVAVAMKRLHDRDKSGGWVFLFYGVPLALNVIVTQVETPSVAWGLELAALGILLWAFVEFAVLRGTVGPNKYGPDPFEESN